MSDGSSPRHPFLPHPAFSAAAFSLPAAFDHPAILDFAARGDYADAIGESVAFVILGDQETSGLYQYDYEWFSAFLNALYTALRSQPPPSPTASQ